MRVVPLSFHLNPKTHCISTRRTCAASAFVCAAEILAAMCLLWRVLRRLCPSCARFGVRCANFGRAAPALACAAQALPGLCPLSRALRRLWPRCARFGMRCIRFGERRFVAFEVISELWLQDAAFLRVLSAVKPCSGDACCALIMHVTFEQMHYKYCSTL